VTQIDKDVEVETERSSDERDARLLRELAQARAEDASGLRAKLITTEILTPHWGVIRRVARLQLRKHFRPSNDDVDEVAVGVFLRLASALENKQDFGKPFRYVVLDNVQWECIDHRRRYQRRRVEALRPPGSIESTDASLGRKRSVEGSQRDVIREQDDDGPESSGLAAQARAFRTRIESLPERDRTILSKRFLADAPPDEIAEELGLARGALDTATHRALRKALTSDAFEDVRNVRRPPEGEA